MNPDPLPKVKQIPKEQIVKDLCDLIKWMPLTDEQITALYDVILLRKNDAASRK